MTETKRKPPGKGAGKTAGRKSRKRPSIRSRLRRKAPTPPPDVPRFCDVVMKGGITSGVAYPLAMCELAKAFRFKNIGGTSTGAIAAAYTAAAEYARGSRDGGFDALAELPEWSGRQSQPGRSNLLSLFQPARGTAPLFNIFVATLRGRRNRIGRAMNIAWACLTNLPLHILCGALPGLILGVLAASELASPIAYVSLALSVILVLIGVPLAVGVGLLRVVLKKLPANFYGVCTGYVPAKRARGTPLTPWIMETVDRIAGRSIETDPPLTFGDLRRVPDDLGGEINLEMMTTNLTQGRPMRVPFEDPGAKGFGQYYFDPAEMRRFFPPRIVDWLVAHAPTGERHARFAPLLPLPKGDDLPVAFGARLSLSYPMLLSAVPLYTIDWTREMPGHKPTPERCWFSDGGITSNFPVHFFDQPLPRWPTFAVNLRPPHIDLPDEEVWMPRSNRQRGVAMWYRFEDGRGPSLKGFIHAIKDVGQNWMDNEQARVPGYRDRVVHITLKPQEGGVNLNMPGDVIRDIADRGRRAGNMLVERFATGPKWDVDGNWENHRWVRYRSTMHVVQELLEDLTGGFEYSQRDQASYEDLLRRPLEKAPLAYPWYNEAQRKFAIETSEALAKLAHSWEPPNDTFGKVAPDDKGPPEPYPTLRIFPRI